MADEKKLYPLKFCPVTEKTEWGSEEFLIADLGYVDPFVKEGWLASNAMSEVMETFLDRMVGENAFEYYGLQFPFQIKKISVGGKMPLTVCPDDEVAETRYDALGKEKVWYVKSAEKGAELQIGFSRESSAAEVFDFAGKGRMEELVNAIPAKPGDMFCIPAGVVHGIKGKLELYEISECSAVDLAMSGESLEDAIDFINYSKFIPEAKPEVLKVKLVRLDNPEMVETEIMDSCISYSCISGKACIQCRIDSAVKLNFEFGEGESILVPAEIAEYSVVPLEKGSLIIETIAAKRVIVDSNINPDVPETLNS